MSHPNHVPNLGTVEFLAGVRNRLRDPQFANEDVTAAFRAESDKSPISNMPIAESFAFLAQAVDEAVGRETTIAHFEQTHTRAELLLACGRAIELCNKENS